MFCLDAAVNCCHERLSISFCNTVANEKKRNNNNIKKTNSALLNEYTIGSSCSRYSDVSGSFLHYSRSHILFRDSFSYSLAILVGSYFIASKKYDPDRFIVAVVWSQHRRSPTVVAFFAHKFQYLLVQLCEMSWHTGALKKRNKNNKKTKINCEHTKNPSTVLFFPFFVDSFCSSKIKCVKTSICSSDSKLHLLNRIDVEKCSKSMTNTKKATAATATITAAAKTSDQPSAIENENIYRPKSLKP